MKGAALATALLLAACGGGGESGDNSTAEETAAPAPVEQIPPELQVDPTNTVVPLAPPSATPTPSAGAALPAALHGRWALGDADCDPANADVAKGLMVVTADRVAHYESRGVPTKVTQVAPGKVTAELAFTGEGQEWTRTTTFTLLDGGRTLTSETPADPETPMRNLRYLRCPA